ncbi:MAG: transposase, partial [Anaerolineae bacterium]|nr:transposase [Anaerolineae bacterium]
NLEFENTGSIEDWLVEAAQTVESPDTDDSSHRPKTVTDFLTARSSEIASHESSGSGATDDEHGWVFPEDDNWSAEGEPGGDPERIALGRKPTDPLPPSVRSQLTDDDLLAQQFKTDSLVHDSDAAEANPGQMEVEASFERSGGADGFEPPVLPEEIIASWEQSPPEDTGTEAKQAGETLLFDEDDGVARLEALADEIRHTRATAKLQQEPLKTNIDETFQRLAAEEPPMPKEMDSDSGTVGDLYAGVNDPAFQNVLQILRGEEEVAEDVPPPEMVISDASSEGATITQSEIEEIFTSFSRRDRPHDEYSFDENQSDADGEHPAHLILETALDESTPADAFSLDELISSIERQLEIRKPSIRPLPSWEQDQSALGDDLYVREPDFLAGVIADVDTPFDMEDEDVFGDATTYAGEAFEPASNAETELLRHDNYPSTLPEMDWLLEPPVAEDDTDGVTKPIHATTTPQQPDDALPRIEEEEPEFSTEFERLAAFNLDAAEREQTPPLGLPAIQDPYIAQVALSLTQISLEELAAAVLTQTNEIIAHAGRMGRNDIEEIRMTIEDQWDTGTDQANIRFITLPSSGKDYLLYSRRTVNDLTLSLLFPGSTPLRDIRKQGKRLLEALMSVPEPEGYDDDIENDSILTAASQSDVRNIYTYIWLLRDPDMQLNEMVASAIESGLKVQLEERNWQILSLEVRTECVYLLADVPGEVAPYEVIRDLKRRSAEIARKQNPIFGKLDVWADSYLIVTPGRALDEDEIQEFISFERIS